MPVIILTIRVLLIYLILFVFVLFNIASLQQSPTELRAEMLRGGTSAVVQWADPSLGPAQRITDERYYNLYYQVLIDRSH